MGLSVCMIVKNEERNIVRAVENARKIADEIIILDTGSTDNTRRLLDSIGQPFKTTEWRDSFSLARNESLALCTLPWIFWMDADDIITDDCAMKINKLKQMPPDSVFMFDIINANTEIRDDIGQPGKFKHIRMFPNFKGIKFQGRVHEQVVGEALLTLNRLYAEDVLIEHHGYSVKQHQTESLRRNIRLQMLEHPFGFPENTDFFSFELGPDIFCIYHPRALAIWYRHIYVATLDPFVSGCPDTHAERFMKMQQAAKDYLRSYADGMRVCKKMENAKVLTDIEAALKDGKINVCAVA